MYTEDKKQQKLIPEDPRLRFVRKSSDYIQFFLFAVDFPEMKENILKTFHQTQNDQAFEERFIINRINCFSIIQVNSYRELILI